MRHPTNLISDFAGGRLSSSEAREIRLHIQNCRQCRKIEDLENVLVNEGKIAVNPEFPSSIDKKIFGKIAEEKEALVKNEIRRQILGFRFKIAAFASFFFVLCGAGVFWYLDASSGSLALIQGGAFVRDETGRVEKLSAGKTTLRVFENEEITIEKGGQATLEFYDYGLVTLGEETRVRLSSLPSPFFFGPSKFEMSLLQGHIVSSVQSLGGSKSFAVRTAPARISVHGTAFAVTSESGGSRDVTVDVFEGTVKIELFASQNIDVRISRGTVPGFVPEKIDSLDDDILVAGGQQVRIFTTALEKLENMLGTGRNHDHRALAKFLKTFTPYEFRSTSEVQKTETDRKSISTGLTWTILNPGKIWSAPIILNRGRLLAVDESGQAVLFTRDGRVLQRKNLPSGSLGGSAFGQKSIAVPTGNRGILLLNSETLEIVKEIKIGALVGTRVLYSAGQSRFYAGSSLGEIICFNEEGATIWKRDIGGGIYAVPALITGGIAFAAQDGSVYGFAAETGEELWRLNTEHSIRFTSLVHSKGKIYVGDQEGWVTTINDQSGQIMNSQNLGAPVKFGPLLAPDALIVPLTSGVVIALGRDGSTLWSREFVTQLSGYTEFKNIIPMPFGKEISWVDSKNGKTLRSIKVPSIVTGITIEDNTIWAVTDEGLIFRVDYHPKDILELRDSAS